MRTFVLCASLVLLAACGSSTDTTATRYNFGLVDGLNQSSVAGAPTLAKPITAQLTRDPNGKFATRVFDFLLPAFAYAQGGLDLPGDPVPGRLVCGEESETGEPKIVPLCAFTLADGKAPNVVQGGTKAGVYMMRFTAQVPEQIPIKDSTSVTVLPGNVFYNEIYATGTTFPRWEQGRVYPSDALLDQYQNVIPYRMVPNAFAHALGDILGSVEARTLAVDSAGTGTIQIVTASGVYATGRIVTEIFGSERVVTIDFPNGPAPRSP